MSNISGVAMTLRVPGDLHKKLRTLAHKRETSINYEVNVAIRAHLQAEKERRAK